MKQENPEFSRTLSLLRQEKGVSQRAAAGALGISQALLSHYENVIREPGDDLISTPLVIHPDLPKGIVDDRGIVLPGEVGGVDGFTAADGGVLGFRFFGDMTQAPEAADGSSDPWTDKDILSATVSFTFSPVAGSLPADPPTA